MHWSGGRALAAEVDGPWSLHDTKKTDSRKVVLRRSHVRCGTRCRHLSSRAHNVLKLSFKKSCKCFPFLAILPPQPPGVGIAAVGHGEFEQVFSWLIKRAKEEHRSDVKSKHILSSN